MDILISFLALVVVVVLLYKLFQWDAHPRSQELRQIAEDLKLEYLKVGNLHLQAKDPIPLFLVSGQYNHVQHLGQGKFNEREIKFFDYALFGTSLAGKAFSVLHLRYSGQLNIRIVPKGTFRLLDVKSDQDGWKEASWLGSEWHNQNRQIWVKSQIDQTVFNDQLKTFIDQYPGLIIEFLPGQIWLYKLGDLISPVELTPQLNYLAKEAENFDKTHNSAND